MRLRYGCIIKAVSCEKDEAGRVVLVHAEAVPNSVGADVEGHKPKGVIHFVDAAYCYEGPVYVYGRLFDLPNPGAAEDIIAAVNPDSLIIIEHAVMEAALKDATPGQSFQFEREGYFCVDSKYSAPGRPVFNRTAALRDNKKAQAK